MLPLFFILPETNHGVSYTPELGFFLVVNLGAALFLVYLVYKVFKIVRAEKELGRFSTWSTEDKQRVFGTFTPLFIIMGIYFFLSLSDARSNLTSCKFEGGSDRCCRELKLGNKTSIRCDGRHNDTHVHDYVMTQMKNTTTCDIKVSLSGVMTVVKPNEYWPTLRCSVCGKTHDDFRVEYDTTANHQLTSLLGSLR